MTVIYVFIGFLAGVCSVGLKWWLTKEKYNIQVEETEKDKIDISLQDIIRLAALNTIQDVSSLIIEYKINVKMPEFYEKYLALSKHERELYFSELITIFTKNKREYVEDLFDRYTGLSTQDVLLLLMGEMQLDNKTMARIMGLGMETLKKRKTRLKAKLLTGGPPGREEANV